MAIPPGFSALYTGSMGIFSNLLYLSTTLVPSGPVFSGSYAAYTITQDIGTTGGNISSDWATVASDFNATISSSIATMQGATGDNSIPGSLSGAFGTGGVTGSSGMGAGQFYFSIGVSPPAPTPTVSIPFGENRVPILPPNEYTMCLLREFRLFKDIDYTLLECCPIPECFIGLQYESNEDWQAPDDARAFNPTGAISLPAVAAGEVPIFAITVPIGYDGIITGQYHGYIPSPSGTIVNTFFEGSGDIAWRITSSNRYLKDCGNMLVSIGTTRFLSPISGGIRVRSGDIIQYRVQVYNLSGLLTPGLGSIVAGLHGYFYPRK